MPESVQKFSPQETVHLVVRPSAFEHPGAQSSRRNLTVTYAIAAAVWVFAFALLQGPIFLLLPSGGEGGYLWYLLVILVPVPMAVAIWLLLRAAHVPKAFQVSLLGTLLAIACMLGLTRLILQAGLGPGRLWLPIALLLPASYVLIGRLVFPVSSRSGTSQR
jgi:hypothetical protein